MKTRTKAGNRRYMKSRRSAASGNGKCAICCSRVPEASYKTCTFCRDRAHRSYERRRDAALIGSAPEFCDDCQATGFHRAGCRLDRRAA